MSKDLITIENLESKLNSIDYFLNNILNSEINLNIRKGYVLNLCINSSNWSYVWGNRFKCLDVIDYKEFKYLLEYYF